MKFILRITLAFFLIFFIIFNFTTAETKIFIKESNKPIEILRIEEKTNQGNLSLNENPVSGKKKNIFVNRVEKSSKNKIASTADNLGHKYMASNKAKEYHYSYCTLAQRINPENIVTLTSAKEARQVGYVPCKVCKPPFID